MMEGGQADRPAERLCEAVSSSLREEAALKNNRDAALLRVTVREAGRRALSMRERGLEISSKQDGTPVTDADIAADRMLCDSLMLERPGYGWLSEETADDLSRLDRSRTWIVDPIDGTRCFMNGGDEWCVSAALVEDGAPVVACIYVPATDDLYEAVAGQGATLNGRRISVTARAELKGSRLLARETFLASRAWPEPWPELEIGLRKSIALRLCLVAAGAFDANIAHGNTSDWDIAAAHLIVEEAGGVASSFTGEPFVYNRPETDHLGVLAAGPNLHRLILDRASRFG